MKITISEFGGMAPMIEPRRLADKYATVAHNTGFETGVLSTANVICTPSAEFSPLNNSVRSILRPGNDDTRLAFSSEAFGESFASLVAPSDKWGRAYYSTAQGPRFTVADNYIAGGLKINPVSYVLGMPVPLYPPVVGTPAFTMAAGVAADTVRVVYVFTFVDKFGHESAPSAASTIVELPYNAAFTCALTFTPESLPDTNVTDAVRRIYRATWDGASSAFQFIADTPLAMAAFEDNIPLGDEAEGLISTDWVPPPKLQQMAPVASNFVAGFIANTLCYSEARLPHAWPEAFRYPLKYPIVGLKPTQNGLLIATTGKPYWAFGADPASAVPVELDANHPCLSAGSMVDMGGYVIYASTDGLIAVTGQDVKVVSDSYIDRFTWLRDFAPARIVAFAHEGRYLFGVGSVWWVFDPADSGGGFSTLGGFAVTPNNLRQAYYDARRDTTVLLDTAGTAWDVVSAQGADFRWRSKVFETPPVAIGRGRVLSTKYPVGMQVITPFGVDSYTVADDRPFPLRGGQRATTWQVELTGGGRITEVSIGQSPQEFL